jgi:prepilin-type N-terminal cleavage/methylation domain-containing protein
MKIGLKTLDTHGFTIVEVMIVLAVTGAMLIAGLMAINGQQQRTEFSQAVNDIQSQINDVINNVSSGYYTNTNNFKCEAGADGPTLQTVANANNQGANKDCIFLGRALQFGLAGNEDQFNTYNVVGLRQITGSNGSLREAALLDEAKPKLLAPGTSPSSDFPDATVKTKLLYDLKPVKILYADKGHNGGAPGTAGGVAFVSSLAQYNDKNLLESGSQVINVIPLVGTQLGQAAPAAVDAVNLYLRDPAAIINPSDGIAVCFKSGGTDQYAVITIGSNGRQPTTKLDIYSDNSTAKFNSVDVCR